MVSQPIDAFHKEIIAIAYLCGVDTKYLRQEYGVSKETITKDIMRRSSKSWNNPLIEFYRQTKPEDRRTRNSAHLLLAHEGREVPQRDVKEGEPYYAGKIVRANIYEPLLQEVIKGISLEAELSTGVA